MCVLSIKVPIPKKSGNLFNDPRSLVYWVFWHINLLWVFSCQILFMYIYQIYMIYKRIICSLTFLNKPEHTRLHTVILGTILANTRTSLKC